MSANLISGTQRLFHTWTKGEKKNTPEVIKVGGLVPLSKLEEENASMVDSMISSKVSASISTHNDSFLPL